MWRLSCSHRDQHNLHLCAPPPLASPFPHFTSLQHPRSTRFQMRPHALLHLPLKAVTRRIKWRLEPPFLLLRREGGSTAASHLRGHSAPAYAGEAAGEAESGPPPECRCASFAPSRSQTTLNVTVQNVLWFGWGRWRAGARALFPASITQKAVLLGSGRTPTPC
ncbi:uncharacterized protein LY79DRAFT_357957 [Colletotrichum navitas]|uniref:Uncharacterized protein n=1 Tax=Colletotrichum navitas TaxID=681940 RepID=A0AAD8PR29_9PEZI|nr:uncharacterized protein LY79DRAFT_357957 [Colletotrichum navitas]KAK1579169.1 hypothetical protein LY79DRAFT_357957 [Colletotrichum navitas]